MPRPSLPLSRKLRESALPWFLPPGKGTIDFSNFCRLCNTKSNINQTVSSSGSNTSFTNHKAFEVAWHTNLSLGAETLLLDAKSTILRYTGRTSESSLLQCSPQPFLLSILLVKIDLTTVLFVERNPPFPTVHNSLGNKPTQQTWTKFNFNYWTFIQL